MTLPIIDRVLTSNMYERRSQQMDLKCQLKEGTSEKTGNKYVYVSIMLTPTYEKRVFLDNAELELVRLTLNKKEG